MCIVYIATKLTNFATFLAWTTTTRGPLDDKLLKICLFNLDSLLSAADKIAVPRGR